MLDATLHRIKRRFCHLVPGPKRRFCHLVPIVQGMRPLHNSIGSAGQAIRHPNRSWGVPGRPADVMLLLFNISAYMYIYIYI